MRFGQFEVEAEVGAGAHSVVYRAHDISSGRLVAVKQLTGAAVLSRLRDEVQALSLLDDEHVVRLVAAGLDDDPPWLAQSWVDGVSLDRLLQLHGRLSGEQACGVLLGAATGLGHAHARGVLHRDVAPGNVLLDGSGMSMLVDFGMAAPVGSTGVVGTPAFVSPEAAAGAPLDPRSDVYSAGAVLFLLLSGRPPFPAKDVEKVLAAHRERTAPSPSGTRDGLNALVGRCLAKDPDARPADGAALAAELAESAERRYGAGWLARATMAGPVAAALAGQLGSGSAGSGPAGSAARETVVLTTGAVSTGARPTVPTPPEAEPVAAAHPTVSPEEAPPAPARPPGPRRVALAAAAAAVVVVAVAATAVAVSGSDSDGDDPPAASGATPAASTTTEPEDGDDDEGGDSGETDLQPPDDACTLLDEATVQRITGQAVGFESGRGGLGDGSCFWGATRPGIGAYVELGFSRAAGLLGGAPNRGGQPCTSAPSDAVGEQAALHTCPGGQLLVLLEVYERGLLINLLVNDTPVGEAELAPVVASVIEQLG